MINNEIASTWGQMHQYSPAPRYRRRLLLEYLKDIHFTNCLDAGCAQGFLTQEIAQRFHVKAYGCDISSQVVEENHRNFPECEFRVLDIEKQKWPNDQQFDLVISSEVIEHIDDWQSAIRHLTAMTKYHLFLTVPGGKLRTIDKKVGHFRHFSGDELKQAIESHGFTCTVKRVGFPMHSLYKRLINFLMPDKIYEHFSGEKKYSFLQKSLSSLLHYSFYLNDLFNRGEQLIVIAKRK